jgi:hypothetical protein
MAIVARMRGLLLMPKHKRRALQGKFNPLSNFEMLNKMMDSKFAYLSRLSKSYITQKISALGCEVLRKAGETIAFLTAHLVSPPRS